MTTEKFFDEVLNEEQLDSVTGGGNDVLRGNDNLRKRNVFEFIKRVLKRDS